jgi:hypothetical protein
MNASPDAFAIDLPPQGAVLKPRAVGLRFNHTKFSVIVSRNATSLVPPICSTECQVKTARPDKAQGQSGLLIDTMSQEHCVLSDAPFNNATSDR